MLKMYSYISFNIHICLRFTQDSPIKTALIASIDLVKMGLQHVVEKTTAPQTFFIDKELTVDISCGFRRESASTISSVTKHFGVECVEKLS